MLRSIESLAATFMARYDHNRNGTLEIKRPDGLWKNLVTADERYRSNTTVGPAYEEDKLNVSTTYHSIERLLYAADKDSNGAVTPDELRTAIGRYDANKDGQLSYRGLLDTLRFKPADEGNRFERELGERLRTVTSTDLPVR
jgi:Ca2+-binding EF-hand superfamily protein